MRLRDRTKFATYKRRGEWAELVFITVAQGLGFNVGKIWGDSAPYDVTLEMDGRFLRVQVKSCAALTRGFYVCQLSGSDHRLYTAKEFDYFACYVVPVDVWYVFPVQLLLGKQTVVLSPQLKEHKYRRYMEAWWFLTRHHFRRGRRTMVPSEKRRFSSMSRLTRRIVERLEEAER
ncbi:MAG: group I intron-associated PD-(D/E)XK endonuclease [Candidatus Sulfotelmatobacter sp.]